MTKKNISNGKIPKIIIIMNEKKKLTMKTEQNDRDESDF
jgi:hypothetical protein